MTGLLIVPGVDRCLLHESACTAPQFRHTPLPLRPATEFPLPGDNSRFDYASLDAQRGLLFIAHLGASEVGRRAGRSGGAHDPEYLEGPPGYWLSAR